MFIGVTIDGKTPLHIAVDKDEETIIQNLLTQKADPKFEGCTRKYKFTFGSATKTKNKTMACKSKR